MYEKKSWFIFGLSFLLCQGHLFTPLSAHANDREVIDKRIDTLLEKINTYRIDALEKTRDGLVTDLNEWMDGNADFDGQQVQLMITNAERVGAEYGVDVERLKRIHAVARKAILRAEFIVPGKSGPTTLHEFTEGMRDTSIFGDVVAYYGLIDEAEERAAESQRKRVVQYKNLIQVYVKSLTTRDPNEALSGFEKYAKLVRSYVTEQEKQVLDADMKAMLSTQSAVAEFGAMLPFVGETIDVLSIAMGETLDGEEMTTFGNVSTAIFLTAPTIIEQSIKRKFKVAVALSGLLDAMKTASVERISSLNKLIAEKTGADKAIEKIIQKLEGAIPDKIKLQSDIYMANRDKARKYADEFGDVAEREAAFKAGRKTGQARIDKFKEAVASGDPVERRKAMLRIQSDKHAMQGMKLDKVGPDLINSFNNEIEALYGVADSLTKDRLTDTYMSTYAKAFGMNLDTLDEVTKAKLRKEVRDSIDVVLITNPSDTVKVSFDRDVVAKITIKGRKLDVPAEVLNDAYGPSLYQTIYREAPKNPKDVKRLMEQMDQVATDSLHNEAYTDLSVAIYQKHADAQFSDPDQIANVFAFKGNHWFEKAEEMTKKAGQNKEMKKMFLSRAESEWEEGFRQLTKQYKSQIVKRRDVMIEAFDERRNALIKGLKNARPDGQEKIWEALKTYENGISRHITDIPDDLQTAFGIMENIGKSETPASAMRKLANLGMTPQEVGQRMGQHVERMHRSFPKLRYDPVFRSTETFDKKNLTQHMHWPEGWLKAKGTSLVK